MKKLGLVLILTLVATLGLGAIAYAQSATVSVDPATQSVEAGQQAVVEIMIADVTDLYGAEVSLTFDPTILAVDSMAAGAFLDEASGTVISDFDNTAGTVDYAISLLAPAPAVDGSGVLVSITFDTLTSGTSQVAIANAILADVQGARIEATVIDGEVEATVPPDIPEASTLALLGSGMVGLVAFARRKLGK